MNLKGSPRVGTSPGGPLRPILQSKRTDSTAAASAFSDTKVVARNGFAPYKYKMTVGDMASFGIKKDNTFVLPGYHDKLPAPFTNKDHP